MVDLIDVRLTVVIRMVLRFYIYKHNDGNCLFYDNTCNNTYADNGHIYVKFQWKQQTLQIVHLQRG